MKIIQSYWSKPYDKMIGSCIGGWFNKTFHYMSCAFSCLKAAEFYPVELITDKKGKKILIDDIGLPYTSCDDSLDIIDYPIDLWAVGKLFAYNFQNEPFIHMDNDIYIWKPFPTEMINSPLISQSLEESYDFYKEIYTNILKYFEYIPSQILDYRKKDTKFNAVNAGLLGGNNIQFIKEYVKEALCFIERNLNSLNKLKDPGSFNLIFEQYLFYCMAQNKKETIYYYLPEKMDSRFKELVSFWTVPNQNSYIHAIASYKKYYIICEQMTQRLWYEYPEYYKRIHQLINMKRI